MTASEQSVFMVFTKSGVLIITQDYYGKKNVCIMICGQDLSNSGHTTGSIDDLFMETLAQKHWNSFPDDSMAELPQDVYFRSYVLEANHHVPQHSHAFMQFH